MTINQELKRITINRELSQLRRKLDTPDRLLSRVVHQPAIRQASGVVGQSLTRPSGLLGGGLMAFVGTAGYLYLAKQQGFAYNYSLFWLLLVAGFALGLLLELLIRLLTRPK